MLDRDKQTDESTESTFIEEAEDNMFSFWNDFLHEKFTEEGEGVLLALDKVERTITGTLTHCAIFNPHIRGSDACYHYTLRLCISHFQTS
jgi:hypothetical protein